MWLFWYHIGTMCQSEWHGMHLTFKSYLYVSMKLNDNLFIKQLRLNDTNSDKSNIITRNTTYHQIHR